MRRHPLAVFFCLAYAISWLLWSPLWLPRLGVDGLPALPFQHALGALGPIVAAFVASAMERGLAGPADLLKQMGAWKGRAQWILVALAGPFALLILAVFAGAVFGAERPSLSGIGVSAEFPQLPVVALVVYNIVTFGYGEETGWRGFVLPRLQDSRSALSATLLLTLGWAVWHTPLFLYRPGYASMNLAGIAGWLFSLVMGAILLTWLYNESRGSILVVAVFHAAIDVAFTSDLSPLVVNVAGALTVLWGLLVLLWAGPCDLSRHGKLVRTARAPADEANDEVLL